MPRERKARKAARLVVRWGGFVLVSSLALSAAGWVASEPGQQAVLHRGLDGSPTRTGSITELLVAMPLMTLGTLALMAAVARWGHYLQTPSQPMPAPRTLAGILVGTSALFPALQALMLADAFGLLEWERTQLLLHLLICVPLLALGGLLRSRRFGPRMLVAVHLPMPLTPERRMRFARATGTYLLILAAAGLLAAVVAPAWVFVAVIGPGGMVGGVALLAYSLRLQDEERAEQRAAGAQ